MKSEHLAREFAKQCRPWLLARALKICRDRNDADDLVQDTLLRFIPAFGKLEDFPPEWRCEGWLITALTNLFRDQCRKRKIQEKNAQELRLKDEAAEAPEAGSQPAYDAVTDEKFAQALDVLNPKLRETFELHAAGMKYQDISRKLGIPIGTVAKRLHDARTKLREFLKKNTSSEMH